MSDATPNPPPPAWRRGLHSLEHGLLGAVLAALVLVPLLEVVLRRTAGIGIQGSQAFAQHFTLLVSVLGGALAAREGRLLTLSTLPTVLPPAARRLADIFSSAVAAAVCAVLAAAAWQFVQAEPAKAILAYGIPKRVFQWFLPAAFTLVGLRLWWRSAPAARGRLLGLVLVGGLVAAARFLPAERLLWPGLVLVAAATVLGGPLFVTLGGVALLLLHGSGRPAALVPSEHYFLVTDAVLPSLPLFTLAGYFLAEGGASRRLVHLFEAWVGNLRGGPAIITVLVCAFFTSFTGASGVTILALGPLLLPVLLRAGYPDRASLGLVTGAGSLGLLFPPCLPLILYAVIAQRALQDAELPAGVPVPDASINALFLGGLGPGLLLLGLSAWYAIRIAPRRREQRAGFDARAAWRALGDAKWELLLPVVTLAVLLSGLATPVEAAAVAALWAYVTQVFVHRDLHWRRDVPRVLAECGLIIGGVLLILGVAMGLTKYLIFADVPTAGVEWIRGTIHSKWLFLLLLNGFLLVVGCLMDIYSAIVVVVPVMVPMGLAFGVDPVHLGIIFLANLQLGFLTPPVGMNLFLASYRFQRPMAEVTRAVLPLLAVLLAGVILITYVPALTTTLPQLLRKPPPAAPARPAGGG